MLTHEVEQRDPSVGGHRRLAAVDDDRHGGFPFQRPPLQKQDQPVRSSRYLVVVEIVVEVVVVEIVVEVVVVEIVVVVVVIEIVVEAAVVEIEIVVVVVVLGCRGRRGRCWDAGVGMGAGGGVLGCGGVAVSGRRQSRASSACARRVLPSAGHPSGRLQADNAWRYVHNNAVCELLARHRVHHRRIPTCTPKRHGAEGVLRNAEKRGATDGGFELFVVLAARERREASEHAHERATRRGRKGPSHTPGGTWPALRSTACLALATRASRSQRSRQPPPPRWRWQQRARRTLMARRREPRRCSGRGPRS